VAGATVEADTVEWIQLTADDGRYVMPVPLGTSNLTLTNALNGNAVTVVVNPATVDERVDLDPTLQITSPWVTEITPADLATGIPIGVEPTVRFSEPVDRASLDGAVQLRRNGDTVATEIVHQGALVTLVPQAVLQPETVYEVQVTNGVLDLHGYSLGTPVTTSFTTEQLVLPSDIDADKIYLIEPDVQGEITVQGLAGAVPAGYSVFIENRTSYSTVDTVAAAQDGSFSLSIPGAFGDEIQLHVLIPGANEVLLPLGPWYRADLRAAYNTGEAMDIVTIDGVTVALEAGTFVEPTWVSLVPRALVDAPLETHEDFDAVYGFDLSFDGAQARKRVHVRIPTPAGVNAGDEILLSRAMDGVGEKWWMLYDLMRVDGDVITTERPTVQTQAATPNAAPRATSFSRPNAMRVLDATAVQEARDGAIAISRSGGEPESVSEGALVELPSVDLRNDPGPAELDPEDLVVGIVEDGSFQVQVGREPVLFLGLPMVNFSWGIFDLTRQYGALLSERIYPPLLPPVLLLPTKRNAPVDFAVFDIALGEQLYSAVLPAADEPFLVLPASTYGDETRPTLLGGNPIQFFVVNSVLEDEWQLAPRIRAYRDPELPPGIDTSVITITGDPGAAREGVQIKLWGLDEDTQEIETSAADDGSFTINLVIDREHIGYRYLLGVSNRLLHGEALTLEFSEALHPEVFAAKDAGDEDHPEGIKLWDEYNLRLLEYQEMTVEPSNGGLLANVRPATGWRLDEEETDINGTKRYYHSYALRITNELRDTVDNRLLWCAPADVDTADCTERFIELEFRVDGTEVLDNFDVHTARDAARLGSLLFVASDTDGLQVIDASDPSNLRRFLEPEGITPSDAPRSYRLPLAEKVRGVATDRHGRVIFVGGGNHAFGQARILDPQEFHLDAYLATPSTTGCAEVGNPPPQPAWDEYPEHCWAHRPIRGTSKLTDPLLDDHASNLPAGTPRRIAILSNDRTDSWILGQDPPDFLTVYPSPETIRGHGYQETFTLEVTGAFEEDLGDGVMQSYPRHPVSLRFDDRGAWVRADADNDSFVYDFEVEEVTKDQRVSVVRNLDTIGYVTVDDVGLLVIDVNHMYNRHLVEDEVPHDPSQCDGNTQDDDDHSDDCDGVNWDQATSAIIGFTSGFEIPEDKADQLCNDNPGDGFDPNGLRVRQLFDPIDVAVQLDADRWTLTVASRRYGLDIFEIDQNDPSSLTWIGGQCADIIEGSSVEEQARVGGLAVLEDYPFDIDENGIFDPEEYRDYAVITHTQGYVMVIDITDRENPVLTGWIELPGPISRVVADREYRQLLVSGYGAGLYIVDFNKLPDTFVLLDENGDDEDDRLVSTFEIADGADPEPGQVISGTLLVPELGLGYIGGIDQGLSSFVLHPPTFRITGRNAYGERMELDQVVPFGVESGVEEPTDEVIEPWFDTSGLIRVEADIPAAFALEDVLEDDRIKVDFLSIAPEGGVIDGHPHYDDPEDSDGGFTTAIYELELKRQAENAWEEGYDLFASDPIVMLADLRASLFVELTEDEKLKEGVCNRCVLVGEDEDERTAGLYTAYSREPDVPDSARYPEMLAGYRQAIRLPNDLRQDLSAVYSYEILDLAEVEIDSVKWDISPSIRQEPTLNPSMGMGDVAPGTLLHSGEMSHDVTDMGIKSRGFPLVFSRSYRNHILGSTPLGRGWDHGYRIRLREIPDGTVELFDGRGRRETFGLDESVDGWVPPPGRFVSLERSATGFTLVDAGFNRMRFDEWGRLIGIVDAARIDADTGNMMQFHYDGDQARLTRIEDTLGRTTFLRYDDDGLLTEVEDFDDRTWTYAYLDGRLDKVTAPTVTTVEGGPLETIYVYWDNGSVGDDLGERMRLENNIETFRDAKGQTWLSIGYVDRDGDGHNEEIEWQDWGADRVQFTYTFDEYVSTKTYVTDRRGNLCTYDHVALGHATTITDPVSAKWLFTYNEDHLMTERTEPLGRKTTFDYPTFGPGEPRVGRDRGNLGSVTVEADSRGANGSSDSLVTSYEYDERVNQPITITDPRGGRTVIERDDETSLPIKVTRAAAAAEESTTEYEYNEFGQVIELTNPNANVVTYEYFDDEDGHAEGYLEKVVVDPNNFALETTYEVDTRGNVEAVIDPRGVRHQTSYNDLDWTTVSSAAVTASDDGADPLGYTTVYQYDRNGNVAEAWVPYGGGGQSRVVYEYGVLDEVRKVRREILPDGEWAEETYDYDQNYNVEKVTDAEGQIREFEYDERNLANLIKVGLGNNAVSTPISEVPEYDDERQLIRHTDGRGHASVIEYDGYGRVKKSIDQVGNYRLVAYDDFHQPDHIEAYDNLNSLLAESEREYDLLGRATKLIDHVWSGGGNAALAETILAYDPFGNLDYSVDPLGRMTDYEYDTAERHHYTDDPLANRIELRYDQGSNVVETTLYEATGGSVANTATYDALNRPASQSDPLGNTSFVSYDARNLVSYSIDPGGYLSVANHDSLNRPTHSIGPEGVRVDYEWDKVSRLTEYKDASNNATTWTYDAVGRRIAATYADGNGVSFDYDAAHNLTEVVDQRGITTTTIFDAAGRPTSRTIDPAQGADPLVGPTAESYTYDGLNRLTQATSGTTTMTMGYDSLSRTIAATTGGRGVSRQFDVKGNTLSTDYASGYQVSRGFDLLDRPTNIQGPAAPTAATFDYQGYWVSGRGLGGGALTGTTTFDDARRPLNTGFTASGSGRAAFDEHITWGPRSLKTGTRRADLNGAGNTYLYDGAGRTLTSGSTPQSSLIANMPADPSLLVSLPEAEVFDYDAAMNRVGLTETDYDVSLFEPLPVDDSGRNRPASFGGDTLEWDNAGNLVRKGDLTFTYDYRNRLTEVRDNLDNLVASYAYDSMNRRVQRTVGSTVRETVWDGWREVEEYVDGELTEQRIYGLGIDEIVHHAADLDQVSGLEASAVPVYDSSGNIAALTDVNGKPVERYSVSTYGDTTITVDSVSPEVDQVRIVGGDIWVEMSEEVMLADLETAIGSGAIELWDTTQDIAVGLNSVSQPVQHGELARRRMIITTTDPPVVGNDLRLTFQPDALIDTFHNKLLSQIEITFPWSATDTVVHDTEPPKVSVVIVRDGRLEIEFTEEVDPALAAATIEIDGTTGHAWE
ncbi:MAG: Ig-like domain-containing protein, partial [Acidobacteriota bacterium]